jgi:chromate transporter
MADPDSTDRTPSAARLAEVFTAFLKLGFVSFGGPIAHLGYFNDEFVTRRKWLSAARYAEIVALCQFLPGPASSQVGMTLGLGRAGIPGAFAAWLGFTLPSAVLMIAFAYGVRAFEGIESAAWVQGLKIAAVAVVAQAIVVMARTLCPDLTRIAFALGSAALAIFVPTTLGQIGALVLGGVFGWRLLKDNSVREAPGLPDVVSKRLSLGVLTLFFVLLAALPLAARTGPLFVDLFDAFYRAGALVFGGGHVVLPLLERAVIPAGWIDSETFLAGYGAAQAVPGPLFTFAGYLGTAIAGGWGGVLCLVAIFLPSFLLIIGVVPYWNALRSHASARSVLKGVNAAVAGILAAAFIDPIVPGAITNAWDAGIAVVLFALLMFARARSWLIVALGAAASSAAALL